MAAKFKLQKTIITKLILGLLLILLPSLYQNFITNDEGKVAHFAEDLAAMQKDIEEHLLEVPTQGSLEYADELRHLKEHGMLFFESAEGKLTAANNNQVDFRDFPNNRTGLFSNSTGWFLFHRVIHENYERVAAIKLYDDYPIHNEYLSDKALHFNYFFDAYELIEKLPSLIPEEKLEFPVLSYNGIHYELHKKEQRGVMPFLVFLELFGFTVLLWAFMGLCKQVLSGFRESVQLLIVATDLLILRYLLLRFSSLFLFHESELFGPEIFAMNDWLPSLGDLLLHLLFVAFLFPFLEKAFSAIQNTNWYSKIASLVLLSTLLLIGKYAYSLVLNVVSNSTLHFGLLELDQFSWMALLALLIIGKIYLLLYFYASWVVKYFHQQWNKSIAYSISLVLFALVLLLSIVFELDQLPLFYLIPVYYFIQLKQAGTRFTLLNYLPELIVLSLVFAFQLRIVEENRLELDAELHAQESVQERDEIAEYLLGIYRSDLLNQLEKEQTPYSIDSKPQNNHPHLSGYLSKFKIMERVYPIDSAFKDIEEGDFEAYTRVDEGLYRRLPEGPLQYKIELQKKGYIAEIYFTESSESSVGFPSLLMDKRHHSGALFNHFSSAKYKNGLLLWSKGKYDYPVKSSFLAKLEREADRVNQFVHQDHIHRVIKENDAVYLVSYQQVSMSNFLSKCSVNLFFYSSILLLVWYIYVRLKGRSAFSFKVRLQSAFLFLLFFSTLSVAGGGIWYLIDQHQQQAIDALEEQLDKALSFLGDTKSLYDNSAIVEKQIGQDEIQALSRRIDQDINWYNADGTLMYSTQQGLYNLELVAPFIHSDLGVDLSNGARTSLKKKKVNREAIGGMEYYSAYAPMMHPSGGLIGVLNIPYFAKTDALAQEIKSFLLAFVNFYLLLTLLSIVIAILIANRITRPISTLQEHFSLMSVQGLNSTIKDVPQGELGTLVKSYNRMVLELDESIKKLSEAEREGAWKEMAQQVAHEIKNPLTPMKLSLQHLQMRWSSMTNEEREEGVRNTSANLIQQIDTLSSIAEQFSNFARTPEAQIESVELVQIIQSAVAIYNGVDDVNVQVVNAPGSCLVMGDAEQLVRIFNNLIKNAVQAFEGKVYAPDERKSVELFFLIDGADCEVQIKDNGKGIPAPLQQRIFEPKFTTKDSGMGLGLAMVKRMLEGMEGSISFNSEEGKGTSFMIRLKKT